MQVGNNFQLYTEIYVGTYIHVSIYTSKCNSKQRRGLFYIFVYDVILKRDKM